MATITRFAGNRTNPNAPTTAAGFRAARAANRPSQVSVKPGPKPAPDVVPDQSKLVAELREENRVLREKLAAAEGKLSTLASELAPKPAPDAATVSG